MINKRYDFPYRADIIMETLTLNLPSNIYQRLTTAAERLSKSPQIVAQEWLAKLQLPPVPPKNERERARQILREAGLLTELGPELKQLADPTISLEEVSAALSQVEGPSLTEIVLEQRRSKEW